MTYGKLIMCWHEVQNNGFGICLKPVEMNRCSCTDKDRVFTIPFSALKDRLKDE